MQEIDYAIQKTKKAYSVYNDKVMTSGGTFNFTENEFNNWKNVSKLWHQQKQICSHRQNLISLLMCTNTQFV